MITIAIAIIFSNLPSNGMHRHLFKTSKEFWLLMAKGRSKNVKVLLQVCPAIDAP
jgi:hypothetical protein